LDRRAKEQQDWFSTAPGGEVTGEKSNIADKSKSKKYKSMVLEIKNLRKHFPVKNVWGTDTALVKALDRVDLKIESGKTFGIVGESGCGKTTLMRTLLRLVEPTSGSVVLSEEITGGQFSSNNLEDLTGDELRIFRRQIGVVFQDPMGALNPRMLIKDIVSEPLVIHGKTDNTRERVIELLKNVGLGEEHLYRYPHEFSGGQRQRIVIARALALDPKILILDEPTSALDVSVQAQILNLLNDLQKKYDLTYIFISHDLSVIEYMCDRLAVMYLGKVVEEADTEELFSNPQHPYTKALLSATPNFEKDKETIMILGDVPSPIKYLDESKAKLATEMTEQERLEIKAIEGKGIPGFKRTDYIIRSSLNEVFPLKKVADEHYARVK
jgi:ABC-type oligopeptide transport system ATPase subunit